MVSVKVYDVNGNRLAKLMRELDYLSAGDFLRTIPLAEERKETEEYMREVSPPKGHDSETTLWLIQNGLRPELPSFREGWRVKRVTVGNRIAWSFTNILETMRVSGAAAKFKSIEFGSKTTYWEAEREFSFKDGRWFHVDEGQPMLHRGNKPADVIGKTTRFVATVLAPKVGLKVDALVRRRLASV